MDKSYTCAVCKKQLVSSETYEYRGAYSCDEHFDQMTESRDFQRQEIIAEENSKTKFSQGLDLSNSPIGKANNDLLSQNIEIASNESGRLKAYEGRSA
jgi:hypothetical protein